MKLSKITIRGHIFTYREDTNDLAIINNIYRDNRYRFPMNMKGITMLDIGAQTGSASVLAAQKGTKVIAFEPYKPNFELLKLNIGELDITCHNIGIGNPGKRVLYCDLHNTGGSGLYREGENLEECPTTIVRVKSILPYLKKNTYIKMDCEGAEREIIPEILPYHGQIKMIFCEIHQEVDNWLHVLSNTGYKIESISDCEYKLTHR